METVERGRYFECEAMTQDELWLRKYNEVLDFMETNHRNPSKHRVEEHLMLNFVKHNRKLLNTGKLKRGEFGVVSEAFEVMGEV